MRTIGLIGGMSWESTVGYYQLINKGVKDKLGGLHSAQVILISVDFAFIEQYQQQGNWDHAAEILKQAAKKLTLAGADIVLICTNTMHKVADEVAACIDIPLLHIADATAEVIVSKQIQTVGLLGTAFTMEQDFYKGRLQKYDLNVLIPDNKDRILIHNVIYNELCLGVFKEQSKVEFQRIVQSLYEQGAEGVILGCTEIGLLIKQVDTSVLLLDTTQIHAEKAVEFAV